MTDEEIRCEALKLAAVPAHILRNPMQQAMTFRMADSYAAYIKSGSHTVASRTFVESTPTPGYTQIFVEKGSVWCNADCPDWSHSHLTPTPL